MEKIYFELENIKMTYLDKDVLKIERLAVHQFDRIGIVGKNGAGKIKPSSGIVKSQIEYGYFEQLEAPTVSEANAMKELFSLYPMIGHLLNV